jgi:hypothetical protein
LATTLSSLEAFVKSVVVDGYTGDVASRGFARMLLVGVMCLPISHWLNVATPFYVVDEKSL